ncbi:metalloprotease PmbA [soil metagenome]
MKRKEIDGLLKTAQFVVAEANRLGATACDVTIKIDRSVSTDIRLGQVETLNGADSITLSFRAFIDQRRATMTSSDIRRASLTKLVRDTISMAREMQPDPFAGLPDAQYLATNSIDYDCGAEEIAAMPVEAKIELAMRTEKAALAVDHRISVGDTTSFADGTNYTVYANSLGFAGGYGSTVLSLSTDVVAKGSGSLQGGQWYSISQTLAKLESPEAIGRIASERALRSLGARKMPSQKVPVVFDPLMAAALVRQFISAASGSAIYTKRSFLLDKLDQLVASNVTIIDDALMPDGLRSKPFDSEGLPTGKRVLVDAGKLSMYYMDSYAARKLNCAPNGGSLTNLYLAAGTQTPEEIIASVENGLYLTKVSGNGLNPVTGDYSVGASGLWIENGRLVFPVEGITIAGNLLDMFQNIDAVGNDLSFSFSTNAPTIKFASMVVAGQ